MHECTVSVIQIQRVERTGAMGSDVNGNVNVNVCTVDCVNTCIKNSMANKNILGLCSVTVRNISTLTIRSFYLSLTPVKYELNIIIRASYC